MSVRNRQSDDWQESCSRSVRDAETARLDVYLRSPAPTGGRQREVLAEVIRLDGDGVVDESGAEVWGNRICPEQPYTETSTGAEFLAVVDEIERWSAQGDPDAITMFEQKTVQSSITDQTFDVIVPPHVCLTLTVDSVLSAVVPARVDGECVSATEFVATLRESLAEETAAAEA